MGPVKTKGLVAEINVTPLVDVMLVLLIIFMVTAPMMTHGVDVDLPETTAKALPQKEESVIVTVGKEGNIHLNKIQVDETLLRQELLKLSEINKDTVILLKADKETQYGLVVRVMAAVKEAGFDNLGMVTKPEE